MVVLGYGVISSNNPHSEIDENPHRKTMYDE